MFPDNGKAVCCAPCHERVRVPESRLSEMCNGDDVCELAGHEADCAIASSADAQDSDVALIAEQVNQILTTTTKHDTQLTSLDSRLNDLEATTARLSFTHSSLESTLADLIARVSAIESQLAIPHPPPPPAVDLEIAVERLAVDLDSLRAALTTVEMRASVEVQSESLRLREEFQAVKGLAMGLKASVGFLLQRSSVPIQQQQQVGARVPGTARAAASASGSPSTVTGGKSVVPSDTKL
ncbi:hypothetical protein BCR44DRAFT_1246680 [Catenaria anguillulae PL171]|uniref:Uncharacterized protein n=1 Tax=Catenaria anguillulae PL171 TaxID=765915 RepID=A0A1Y2I1T7_9FUNG|nr:hypothetical protein BCR44DRAFT_1246680 [Catenaria anguillulae PL171]